MNKKANNLIIIVVTTLFLSSMIFMLRSTSELKSLSNKVNDLNEELDEAGLINSDYDSDISALQSELHNANTRYEELELRFNSELEDVKSKYRDLEGDYNKLLEQVSNIPIDDDLIVKEMIEEWIGLFFYGGTDGLDKQKLSQIMNLNADGSNTVHSSLTSYAYTEKLELMISHVFHEEEGISVRKISGLNDIYEVEDTDGNKFRVYYNGDSFYSLWNHAIHCYYEFDKFFEALKKKNSEELLLFFLGDGPETHAEIIEDIEEKYIRAIEDFDVDTMQYIFEGIDLDGFRFKVYDLSGHEQEFHIYHEKIYTSFKLAELMWGE